MVLHRPSETLKRFHLLLELAASAYDYSQCKSFKSLLYGEHVEDPETRLRHSVDRETVWKNFQDEIELNFGRIENDSCSTLATTDDNPGTGRIIDKFLYQPIGRSIERLFLSLELRYFHPPEKSARRIKRFLEGLTIFGDCIPVDEMSRHEFRYYDCSDYEIDFEKSCVSLFTEIGREEKVAKAFQILLTQASSKKRGLRVEAQKQLWSLVRHKNMVFILNAIADLKLLTWDGYTTFRHCSPLDPDFQTHFCFRWEMDFYDDEALIDTFASGCPDGLLCMTIREILETCVRENRGFSSLPINLILELYWTELYKFSEYKREKLKGAKRFAEDLYLAIIAISGYLSEFSYASNTVRSFLSLWYVARMEEAEDLILPLWGRHRTDSDINALELMVHSLVHFYINIAEDESDSKCHCERELAYYMALLNDGDKDSRSPGKLEASASKDYVRKVSKTVGQRGPITYAIFKDMVTSPMVWEKYHQPERQTEATEESEECPDSPLSRWECRLFVSEAGSESTLFSYYSIPFSDSFQEDNLDDLISYIRRDGRSIEQNFEGPGASWFRILKWLKELSYSPWSSPSCHKNLITAAKWWHNFNPYPITGFKSCVRTICETALRTNEDGDTPFPLPSNPCLCKFCEQSRHDEYRPKCVSKMPDLSAFYELMTERRSPTPDWDHIVALLNDSPQLSWDILPCKTTPTHGTQPLCTNDIDLATLPSPCQCRTCKRTLHINVKTANIPPQTRNESEPAKSSSSSRRQTRYPERSSPKIEDQEPQFAERSAVVNNPATPLKGWLENEPAESSSSFRCQTRYYPERSSPKMEDNDHQFAVQSAMVNDSATPLKGRLGLFKSKLEGEEPRPQVTPLPLRYSNNTDENARPLVPLRKKQKIHHVSTLQPRIEEHPLPATEYSPLQGQPRILKRKIEEVEPRPQIAPLPRRYRNNTDEDAQPATLGPVRKRLKTSLRGPIITKNDEVSTESDIGSEDAMSVDEDFLTANSKLSHLTIGN